MLSWSYVPNEDTIYEGVKRLAPATRMEIDLETGARTTRRYWRLEPASDSAHVGTLNEACELIVTFSERLNEVLERMVRR